MGDNLSVTKEENISKVSVIYGKGKLKDILDSLLEKLFIKEIEKDNGANA